MEWKLDGVRIQAHVTDGSVRLFTRTLDDITARLPEVTAAMSGPRLDNAVFDGELIALRPDGRPRPFQDTAARAASGNGATVPLTPFFFDALHVDGIDLLDLPDEAIRRTFEVNTLSLFWVAKAFLPQMVDAGSGHLVTVASAAGLVGVARQTDYSASKHAAVGFDESLRVELRHIAPRVRTTVVCPYYIDTGMFEGVRTRVPALLPILRQRDVAMRIADAIARNRRVLVMPPIVRLLPVLRALPPTAFDRIMDLFGVNASMDHFVGHAGAVHPAADPAVHQAEPDPPEPDPAEPDPPVGGTPGRPQGCGGWALVRSTAARPGIPRATRILQPSCSTSRLRTSTFAARTRSSGSSAALRTRGASR